MYEIINRYMDGLGWMGWVGWVGVWHWVVYEWYSQRAHGTGGIVKSMVNIIWIRRICLRDALGGAQFG